MKHTPGALRAAKVLFGPFATAQGDPIFGEWVAEIIDRETAAPELLELVKAAFQWIDAVPKNTPLPSMPGLDRDWANSIIAKSEGTP